jgi:hypothetical protein
MPSMSAPTESSAPTCFVRQWCGSTSASACCRSLPSSRRRRARERAQHHRGRGPPPVGRLIVTEAELDGQRLTVVLDTGSEVSVGNAALRRALARRGLLSGERPVTLGSVTGATLPASYMSTKRLDVGGVGR